MPPARGKHRWVVFNRWRVVDSTGHVWLFGGLGVGQGNATGTLSDLFMFDAVQHQWAWMGGPTVVEVASRKGRAPHDKRHVSRMHLKRSDPAIGSVARAGGGD